MGSTAFSQLMKSCSANPVIERAQPWLGTIVSIRVEGLPFSRAHQAIHAAFGEIGTVHRLMSFHRADSDVSRLNREGSCEAVKVHPYTYEVLKRAITISAHSGGCFDVSVGRELVGWGMLPRPAGKLPLPEGCWRDIELRSDGRVAFHRPLWIDLGGIAKGYAADRAVERLRESGAVAAVVNAGGDIRVHGKQMEAIGLDLGFSANPMPVLELANGSVASSSGRHHRRWRENRFHGPHVDGARRSPAPTDRFVCVLAERCVVADALTKVVMAEGQGSLELLRRFGASAHLHDPLTGWQSLNGGTENQ
jgi:FAD:protein FMN transferase